MFLFSSSLPAQWLNRCGAFAIESKTRFTPGSWSDDDQDVLFPRIVLPLSNIVGIAEFPRLKDPNLKDLSLCSVEDPELEGDELSSARLLSSSEFTNLSSSSKSAVVLEFRFINPLDPLLLLVDDIGNTSDNCSKKEITENLLATMIAWKNIDGWNGSNKFHCDNGGREYNKQYIYIIWTNKKLKKLIRKLWNVKYT